jgi:hypothetical protein
VNREGADTGDVGSLQASVASHPSATLCLRPGHANVDPPPGAQAA